jgi:hypothetical protein
MFFSAVTRRQAVSGCDTEHPTLPFNYRSKEVNEDSYMYTIRLRGKFLSGIEFMEGIDYKNISLLVSAAIHACLQRKPEQQLLILIMQIRDYFLILVFQNCVKICGSIRRLWPED